MNNPISISGIDRNNIIKYYQNLYSLFESLEGKNMQYDIIKDSIIDSGGNLQNGLIDFFNMIPQKHVLEILDIFDFSIIPFGNTKNNTKIHLLSLILGVNIFYVDFPGKRMIAIVKHIELLNNIFEGIIQFHGNGKPLVEVEYLYRQQSNQLWYLG